ncbi:hypothetical protein ASU31_06560 [Pedobacter ginsenosidimutans]|uniref:Uncharacterized protein n=1 Tax=Pedobacter ginsenosidimutans TaxID=687842 RepID=A0A0T5VUA9_9SPHI|nr:hypothetical protein [Pedobacter ginsenosidimutans]KRT17327.1 hypothetical protein ASU31_06560 [Pedobacter ginsenosidimutans]
MFKCFFKYQAVIAVVLFALSCSNTNNRPIIKFSEDSSSIIIKNIDEASLFQVKNAYQANADALNLVSVLIKPGDLDSIQDELEVPGKVKILGDSLVFNPDQPFLKGKEYLVESYIGIKFATVGDLIMGKGKQNLKAQRQTLKR